MKSQLGVNLLPCDEGVLIVEYGDVGVAAVGADGGSDSIDLAVAVLGVHFTRGLRGGFGLFVAQHDDGDVGAM